MKPWESQVTPYGTVIRPACAVCYQGWYEHKDHDHDGLESEYGECPFRDCGEWRETKPVLSRIPASDEAEEEESIMDVAREFAEAGATVHFLDGDGTVTDFEGAGDAD